MRRFVFAIAALAVGANTALISQPAIAGMRHYKKDIAPAISERFRNTRANSAPGPSTALDRYYFDEALSPPAGR